MAVLNATATTVKQLMQDITAFLIDENNFTSGNAWKLLSPSTLDENTTEVILEGKGDAQDKIYVGMKWQKFSDDQENILLNGFAGYDPNLAWYEQPGAIPETSKLPCVPLAKDVLMTYWLTANTQRFTFRVEMSNQYEGAYLGFMNPIAIERQYPYPLVIGGSAFEGMSWTNHSDSHSLFINPVASGGFSSLCIRRPDGTWRYGGNNLFTWPIDTTPIDTFTIYKKTGLENPIEDNMFYPVLVYETNPVGIIGELDGVYWLGNRVDLAAKDNVIYKDVTYKVFNNVYNRNDDAYHAMKWV
ncbi:hypothetical protein [Anaerosinus sp.]